MAYVANRVPGIYGCNYRVLAEVKMRYPSFRPKNMLDFGSGPGTAIWAAKKLWSSLQEFNTVEPSDHMAEIAEKLLHGFNVSRSQYLTTTVNKGFDIVMASYAINELDDEDYKLEMVHLMWQYVNTGGILVFVEPGTSIAYKALKKVRQSLLDSKKKEFEAYCTMPSFPYLSTFWN